MKRIEFIDSFRIDHGPLDKQHRELFDLINALADAVEDGHSDRCRDVATRFIDAAHRHFAWEEEFLSKAGFPHLAEHVLYHRRLLDLAEEARTACTAGSTADHASCFEQLVTVFVDDVVRGDLSFKSYLQDKVGA